MTLPAAAQFNQLPYDVLQWIFIHTRNPGALSQGTLPHLLDRFIHPWQPSG
jgi:hypothetical protein